MYMLNSDINYERSVIANAIYAKMYDLENSNGDAKTGHHGEKF